MNELWQEIEQLLRALGGEALVGDLLPPVGQEELEALAQAVASPLPEQLVAYLSVHNGSDGRYRTIPPWELLPGQFIVQKINFINSDFANQLREDGIELDDEQENRGPVKPTIWNQNWIPFADDGIGNLLCVDHDPDEGGQKGQVVLWSADPPYVEVLSISLEEFFSLYLRDLRQGRYNFSEDSGLRKI